MAAVALPEWALVEADGYTIRSERVTRRLARLDGSVTQELTRHGVDVRAVTIALAEMEEEEPLPSRWAAWVASAADGVTLIDSTGSHEWRIRELRSDLEGVLGEGLPRRRWGATATLEREIAPAAVDAQSWPPALRILASETRSLGSAIDRIEVGATVVERPNADQTVARDTISIRGWLRDDELTDVRAWTLGSSWNWFAVPALDLSRARIVGGPDGWAAVGRPDNGAMTWDFSATLEIERAVA